MKIIPIIKTLYMSQRKPRKPTKEEVKKRLNRPPDNSA